MMKTGTSTLNPYAPSYVPLSKRGVAGQNENFKTGGFKSQTPALGYQPDIYNNSSVDNLQAFASIRLKGNPVYGYYGSSSHHTDESVEKKIADEEFDMGIAYLQMSFPGISNESLSDVYLANKGDLEATIDMLNQLEQCPDSSEKLPDSLDIGDVSEPGSSNESASQKLKKVTGEVGTSSSSPS